MTDRPIDPQRVFPQRVLTPTASKRSLQRGYDLHSIANTRRVETMFAAQLPTHSLMQRAGLSVARLALALYPHAQTFWIACGPGNNGGDGLEAAHHLRQWGKTVDLTWVGSPERCSPDTLASFKRARASGVEVASEPPRQFDVVIDALLGIGSSQASDTGPRGNSGQNQGPLANWIELMNRHTAPVLSIDLPSGLDADTGCAGPQTVRAQATLSLVTLKPGTFTALGRDHAGDIWFDPLGCDASTVPGLQASARLPAASSRLASREGAPHASHKGAFGDVTVIGGAPGMTGAALLAATAALHAGAGRVLVGLLDGGSMAVDVQLPELMFRPVESLDLSQGVVVCGCGGGNAVRAVLPKVLSTALMAVLDADALNAIAVDDNLQTQLRHRAARGKPAVLTPHPLEAARLLGCSAAQVQANRLDAAGRLAERFACCVVLKGSGSVIAMPGQIPQINPSGNARLATAGTGDVLAGLLGAALVGKRSNEEVFQAACDAVYRHGEVASDWPTSHPLTAAGLASRL